MDAERPLVSAMRRQNEALYAEVAALRRENAALREQRQPRLEASATDAGGQKNGEEYVQLQDSELLPAADWETEADAAPFLCFPPMPIKQAWDTAVAKVAFFSAWLVPFAVAFVPQDVAIISPLSWYLWHAEAALSAVLLTDVLLTFNTARLLERRWVTSRVRIARLYVLGGWFWADLGASLPLLMIEELQPGSAASLAPGLVALKWLRIGRTVRELQLLQYNDALLARIEEALGGSLSLRWTRIVRSTVGLYALAHTLGCFFWRIASLHPEASWVSAYDPTDSGGSLWDASLLEQYTTCLYWALSTLTTVGYGDIVTRTLPERAFTLAVLLAACLVYGFFVSEIAAVARSLDRRSALAREQLDAVKDYTAWRGMKPPLRRAIREHFESSLAGRPLVVDEGALLRSLPASLRDEACGAVLPPLPPSTYASA